METVTKLTIKNDFTKKAAQGFVRHCLSKAIACVLLTTSGAMSLQAAPASDSSLESLPGPIRAVQLGSDPSQEDWWVFMESGLMTASQLYGAGMTDFLLGKTAMPHLRQSAWIGGGMMVMASLQWILADQMGPTYEEQLASAMAVLRAKADYIEQQVVALNETLTAAMVQQNISETNMRDSIMQTAVTGQLKDLYLRLDSLRAMAAQDSIAMPNAACPPPYDPMACLSGDIRATDSVATKLQQIYEGVLGGSNSTLQQHAKTVHIYHVDIEPLGDHSYYTMLYDMALYWDMWALRAVELLTEAYAYEVSITPDTESDKVWLVDMEQTLEDFGAFRQLLWTQVGYPVSNENFITLNATINLNNGSMEDMPYLIPMDYLAIEKNDPRYAMADWTPMELDAFKRLASIANEFGEGETMKQQLASLGIQAPTAIDLHENGIVNQWDPDAGCGPSNNMCQQDRVCKRIGLTEDIEIKGKNGVSIRGSSGGTTCASSIHRRYLDVGEVDMLVGDLTAEQTVMNINGRPSLPLEEWLDELVTCQPGTACNSAFAVTLDELQMGVIGDGQIAVYNEGGELLCDTAK